MLIALPAPGRHEVDRSLHSYKPCTSNSLPEEKEDVKFLSSQEDVKFLPADKDLSLIHI